MWIEIRAGNKGKSQIISLWNFFFFFINKRQLFVATIQNLCLPSLLSHSFSGINLLPLRRSPCHSSNCAHLLPFLPSLLYELSVISNSSKQICSVFHTQVQRSYWLNFSRTSDLEYLVLNQNFKKKVHQNCLKSLINENLDVVWGCQ